MWLLILTIIYQCHSSPIQALRRVNALKKTFSKASKTPSPPNCFLLKNVNMNSKVLCFLTQSIISSRKYRRNTLLSNKWMKLMFYTVKNLQSLQILKKMMPKLFCNNRQSPLKTTKFKQVNQNLNLKTILKSYNSCLLKSMIWIQIF